MAVSKEDYNNPYDIATKKDDILYRNVLAFHPVETLYGAYKTLLEKEFKDLFKISALISRFTDYIKMGA